MHELLEPLLNNQFLTGGALLGGVAGALAVLRKLPGKIYDWLWRQFTIELTVRDMDEAFVWLSVWLHNQPYSQARARSLNVTTRFNDAADRREVIVTPGEGQHWFFYRGVLVLLNHSREQKGGQKGGYESEFSLTVFTKKRPFIVDMLKHARDTVDPPGDERIPTFGASYDHWYSRSKLRPRSLESVVLKHGQLERLLSDITNFQALEQWYVTCGIPYRRGYLLYGEPGNGKSSLVKAIASHLKRPLYLVSLSSKGLDDDSLMDLLGKVPEHGVVLIEDVDCAFEQRAKGEDDSMLTFAGLLNAIDGVSAAEGRLLFMTTNHREKLDPALIRPGRADVQLEVTNPDVEQLERMFLRFFPNEGNYAAEFATQVQEGRCMAAVQNHFIKYRNPIEAMQHASEV